MSRAAPRPLLEDGASARERGARWLALVARLTFAVLVVILPFRARADPLPHPDSSLTAILTDLVIYATDILLVAVLAAWIASRVLDRRRVELGPAALRIPIAALVALAWLTMPFGVEPVVSVAGAIRITLGALLVVYVMNEVDGLRSIALPVGLMLGIQGLVAIGQAATGGSVGLGAIGELTLDPGVPGVSVVLTEAGTRLLRAYGLTPHPNVLGGFLACGTLILLGAPVASRAARAGQVALVALAVVALVATFSRGAWLGGLVGGGVGAALLVAGGSRADARRWILTGAVALIVAVGAGWLARDAVAARTGFATTTVFTEQRSIDERLEQIRLGWRVVAERPLTGAGASALPIAMGRLEPNFPFALYPPHLVALAVAGELGVGGGLAYVGMLLAPWVLLLRARGRWTHELIGATAAFASLTVVSLFDLYPWAGGPGRTLGWLVIGLWAMAYVRMGRGRAGESDGA